MHTNLNSDFNRFHLSREELPRFRDRFGEWTREQRELAEAAKDRELPTRRFRDRAFELLEGPWAPSRENLPVRRSPELSGNSRLPFREPALSESELAARGSWLAQLKGSTERVSLTDWSTAYKYQVPIPNLQPELAGLKILHLSDIHFMRTNERSLHEFREIVRWLERSAERPDLALFSGDLITVAPDDLNRESLKLLKRVSELCTHSFAVRGNHDFHGHRPALISRLLERSGFYDISNLEVSLSKGGARLNIVGVDDAYFGAPRPPERVSQSGNTIVLTHNLDAIRSNFPSEVDLILSGHTHWGECRLIDGVKVMKLWGYADNHNQHTKEWDILTNRTASYVHPGLARYYVKSGLIWHPPGIAIHTLVPMVEGTAD